MINKCYRQAINSYMKMKGEAMDNNNRQNTDFSAHCCRRSLQRGIRLETIRIIIEFTDNKIPARNGRRSLSVSKRRIKRLIFEGRLKPEMEEKLKGVVVVIANDNNNDRAVTIPHGEKGKRGRHYRKNVKWQRRNSRKQSRRVW